MDYILTFLWSMTPIGELRAAIPLGMQTYDLAWFWVLPLSVLGNLVPAFFWLLALPRLATLVTAFPNPAGRFLEWRSGKLRAAHAHRFYRQGALALVLLVAVPLPLTGVWTGSLAAWIFEIPFWRAIPPIALGAVIAGIVVTSLTSLGLHFIG